VSQVRAGSIEMQVPSKDRKLLSLLWGLHDSGGAILVIQSDNVLPIMTNIDETSPF